MDNYLFLKNQNILVTGVSRASGIGAAIAKMCSQAGAKVITHGNPQYDADRSYSDASDDFYLNLERYKIETLSPSDLEDPQEPAKVIAS